MAPRLALGLASLGLMSSLMGLASVNTVVEAKSLSKTAPCASPPANFNPLIASDTQLLAYGLPRRPGASSAFFSQWVTAVTHANKRDCSEHTASIAMEIGSHKPGKTTQLATQGRNWSGWEDINNTYYLAIGTWTIPCINTSQSPTGSDVGDWVGLGGENNASLLQAGSYWDYSSRTWKSFYEEVGSGEYTTKADEFATVACGHTMYASIDYGQNYTNQSNYFVEDETSGSYWTNHNSFVPAHNTAEWIDEASICNPTTGAWRLLAKFGSVTWTSAGAGPSYTGEHGINYWETIQYYSSSFSSPSLKTAQAGSMNSSGNGFTDTWASVGTDDC